MVNDSWVVLSFDFSLYPVHRLTTARVAAERVVSQFGCSSLLLFTAVRERNESIYL